MDDLNKKEVAQEVLVQEQPVKVKIEIINLNEVNSLINEIVGKIKELQQFKLEFKVKE